MRRQVGIILTLFALSFTFLILQRVSASHAVNARIDPILFLPPPQAQSAQPEVTRKISSEALLQISALLDEKQSRTPAQQKIDSQLLYATKMRRGERVAPGVQMLSVDAGVDDAGQVTVDITALVDDPLISLLGAMNVEIVSAFPEYHALRAKASLDQLETIAGLPQVKFIQPKQEPQYWRTPAPRQPLSSTPTRYWDFNERADRVRAELQKALLASAPGGSLQQVGSVTSQGDTTHNAFAARGTFNVDGTGVKIGVLSDGVTNLSTSQALGDLGPVNILPEQGGSGNEGTAMLEIIHDLAPGAQLYFATTHGGIASFANNIRGLRSAGCDIILDDAGYSIESPFQDGQTSSIVSANNGGLLTQAVNEVAASGALYFSAAANLGNKNDGTSETWEGNFVNGGTLSRLPGGSVHDFDSTAAIAQYNMVTTSENSTDLYLQWSDPLGGSNNDYDLFVLDGSGMYVMSSSTNIQSGTQDPYEQSPVFQKYYQGTISARVVVFQKTGAADRFLHLSTNRAQLAYSTEGGTYGHKAASGSFGVAAVCASCVFPSAFNSGNTIETFSSDGPRHIFFNGDGTSITPSNLLATGGTILQKPDFAAADGVSVSSANGAPNLFFGTSAAAAHAAAIAALIKSANPALTPAQTRAALASTAIDIEAPGTDRDSGAGIMMPYSALQSLGPPVVGKAFLELSTVNQNETCCNSDGFIGPGESANLTISLKNSGLLSATSVKATLTSSTPGVRIVNGNAGYPNLAASNGSGANATPFSISLDPNLPYNPSANFTLTINYAGGHQASQVFSFSIQFGIELITNGGFESGDFSGWNVSTVATGGDGTPFHPWAVNRAGAGGDSENDILTTTPLEGSYDAWNGFDGGGPMEFRMYRDVSIPAGSSLTLFWKDRVQWNFCCNTLRTAKTYQVQIRNPTTNAVLSTPYSFSTNLQQGYRDTGWQVHTSDLSAYAGQTIRIFFLEVIPDFYTGPGQIEFDSISISNEPPQPPVPTPAATPGPATPGLYGGTRTGQLIKLDTTTGVGTLIGSLPNYSTEIEFNNSDRRAFTQLFTQFTYSRGQEFDISSGAALGGVVVEDGTHFDGLEWVGSFLYGVTVAPSTGPSELRTLHPSTGSSLPIGFTGMTGPITGLAYDATTGTMYGLTDGASGGTSSLVTVNLTTGAATMIGLVGFNGGSLEFGPDGNLYAGSTGGTGNLYRINTGTGASTLVGATGFTDITGLALVNAVSPTPTPTPTPPIRFSAANYSVNEASADVMITVTRTGDTSGDSVVHYATNDIADLNSCSVNTGLASPRCDYLATMGTLRFAPGETSRTFLVPIVDDSYADGNESFIVTISDVTGGVLDFPRAAVVTIIDNDASSGPNPTDQSSYFVRQHYRDFLNREPDPAGLQFWINEIESCGADAACREVKRINVSAAFFFSIEFQETGYLVERLYKTSFGNDHGTVSVIRLNEFLADSQTIARGVIVNSPGWEQQLENNKVAFIDSFVGRRRFTDAFGFLPNRYFVDRLNSNADFPLSQSERDALLNQLNGGTKTRAQVLRAIAEHPKLISAERNRAFVLMQFFSYLRRNPNDPQDTDYTGYDFWLTKLNQFGGNFQNAEMVKAFISADEYRHRFGP